MIHFLFLESSFRHWILTGQNALCMSHVELSKVLLIKLNRQLGSTFSRVGIEGIQAKVLLNCQSLARFWGGIEKLRISKQKPSGKSCQNSPLLDSCSKSRRSFRRAKFFLRIARPWLDVRYIAQVLGNLLDTWDIFLIPAEKFLRASETSQLH